MVKLYQKFVENVIFFFIDIFKIVYIYSQFESRIYDIITSFLENNSKLEIYDYTIVITFLNSIFDDHYRVEKAKNNFLKCYIKEKDDFSKFFIKFICLIQKVRVFKMSLKKELNKRVFIILQIQFDFIFRNYTIFYYQFIKIVKNKILNLEHAPARPVGPLT